MGYMNENQSGIISAHIVQYPSNVSFCAGCTACEIVCSLLHDGFNSPQNRRIFLERGTSTMEHTIRVCQQCSDHPCYKACPKKDKAMKIDEALGIAYVVEEECIGCGLCVKACPFEPKLIYINNNNKAMKCDLCRTRPEGPACVEYCQVRCIGLSDQPVPTE